MGGNKGQDVRERFTPAPVRLTDEQRGELDGFIDVTDTSIRELEGILTFHGYRETIDIAAVRTSSRDALQAAAKALTAAASVLDDTRWAFTLGDREIDTLRETLRRRAEAAAAEAGHVRVTRGPRAHAWKKAFLVRALKDFYQRDALQQSGGVDAGKASEDAFVRVAASYIGVSFGQKKRVPRPARTTPP